VNADVPRPEKPRPARRTRLATLYHADAVELLAALDPESVDALIADVPYSSGGAFRGDRAQDVGTKYLHDGRKGDESINFRGDVQDQRSWLLFQRLWLRAAWDALKPGAYVMLWTDWRQLAATTDAMQCGGYVWRGIVPWNKGRSARLPNLAYFRHQCEYVVWGSKGRLPASFRQARRAMNGLLEGKPVPGKKKTHPTEKPVDGCIAELVEAAPPGGLIVDPFLGSGSTGVAAVASGRRFIGSDDNRRYVDAAAKRIRAVEAGPELPGTRAA